MSGIYGIYQYDGAPVPSQWLESMRTAIDYYGPHGGGCKVDGAVGLGHLLLQVNPEDAFEKQPVTGERGLVVSAARLDNRAALLEAFKVSASDAPQISDGHLVTLAFDRWGEQLCAHLQGDWAMAAWDARNRRLLLARDACGNATLYYYEGKGYIAFASSLKALLAIPGVVKQPDRLRFAQVLVSWQHNAELTAYMGFRRLLWAHAMTVGPDGLTRTWRHWSPDGRDRIIYRRDEQYAEAFLEHYTRAVQSCLRTHKPVAATLSGGRDSGSVVVLAATLLASQNRGLTAYTSVPCLPPDGASERRLGNEWELAHATAVMAGANVQHIPIDAANYGVIQGIEYVLDAHDGPSHAAGNHYWIQAVTEAAARDGAGVILSGQMGNAAVSWAGNGSALLALLQGYPATAIRLFLHAEPNPWLTLKRQVLKPLLLPGLRALRRFKSPRGRPWQAYSALNIHMASELDVDARMRAAGHDPTFTFSPLEDTQPFFFRPHVGIGTGIWSEIAARHSISILDPTVNLSMVEFLLRVPDDQFYQQGQHSFLMKRAFRNRLPAQVLNGQLKGLQAADVGHRILRELPAFRECLISLDSLPEAQEILDMPLLHRCLEDLVAKVDYDATARANQILLRGLGVGLFLRHLADSRC
ncbi:MAG: asparagine synthase-related protein [Terracidiphilus sp.]